MKDSPYLKIIIFTVLAFIIGFLIPNTPYFKNKTIKELEKENKILHENINKRNNRIEELNDSIKIIRLERTLLENEIINRNKNISILENKIDSINQKINGSDSTIIKIKKTGYEEINNVNNWNVNQRINFFTEYFERINK